MNNIINKYVYYYKGNQSPINDLMTHNSEQSIIEMKSYQNYISESQAVILSSKHLSGNRILKEILKWGSGSGIHETLDYDYNKNNKCVHIRNESRLNGPYNETFMKYDQDGNEILYLKVYNGLDTTNVIKSYYKKGLLKKREIEKDFKKESIESYNYSKGKLVSIQRVSPEGKEISSKTYNYFPEGKIKTIKEKNSHWEFQMKFKVDNSITYFYYY